VSDTSDTYGALLPQEELDQVLNILTEALNICDVKSTTPEPTAHTVGHQKSPTIQVPGHGAQYKSTLVKILNENSKLSVN